MKDWPENHPKAKAMAKRRKEILDAAKACFIQSGYAGTSMDAIADAAGISLMTLYRHAESKDDLFAATVSDACRARDDRERQYFEGLVHLPFRELLVTGAIHMRTKITQADNVALMRLVIAEASAFPYLLSLAYDGFISHFENLASEVIRAKFDGSPSQVDAASRAYIDCLLGADVLRSLLGQDQLPAESNQLKAELAADTVLNMLAADRAVAVHPRP